MKFKKEVKTKSGRTYPAVETNFHNAIWAALDVLNTFFLNLGVEPIISCGSEHLYDGGDGYNYLIHSVKSFHNKVKYGAQAADISRSNLNDEQEGKILRLLPAELAKITVYGRYYQFLIEGDHFHLEYDFDE